MELCRYRDIEVLIPVAPAHREFWFCNCNVNLLGGNRATFDLCEGSKRVKTIEFHTHIQVNDCKH